MSVIKPYRRKHSYVQYIAASRETVFPLLCPVAEELWVPGWKTEKVISNSGVVEHDCIFITLSETQDSIWIVSKHEPAEFQLEMYKVTPGHTVGKLEIFFEPDERNSTKAIVAYEFTAIGSDGDNFVKGFTYEWYVNFMKGWENAMNHYLQTGGKLA